MYMTRHAPWEIEGKDPGVRTNRPLCIAIDTDCALHYGLRLVETLAGAIISEDWVPNHCLIYAFDCEKSQYLWANRGYNGVKKYLRQKASENALVWEENEARKGTPAYEELERYECSDLEALKMLFVNEYDQWKDVITLRRPLIYKEVQTPYPVVDELLPKNRQRPLNFTNLLCVARKPNRDGWLASTSPLTTRGNAVLIASIRRPLTHPRRGTSRAGGMYLCWLCQN